MAGARATAPADLYPTPTRRGVLGRTNLEAVRREYTDAPAGETFVDVDYISGQTVTAIMADMQRAGWVKLNPTRYATGINAVEVSYWRLTAAGEALLPAVVNPNVSTG